MNILISSRHIWDDLELKMIDLYNDKEIKKIDIILCEQAESLINHINGNISRGNHYALIDKIDSFVKIINRSDFLRNRKFESIQENKIVDVATDLNMLLKTMKNEFNTVIRENASKIVEEDKESRLPNISNLDIAFDMFKPID